MTEQSPRYQNDPPRWYSAALKACYETGCTMKAAAEAAGVGVDTIYKLRNLRPDLAQELDEAALAGIDGRVQAWIDKIEPPIDAEFRDVTGAARVAGHLFGQRQEAILRLMEARGTLPNTVARDNARSLVESCQEG